MCEKLDLVRVKFSPNAAYIALTAVGIPWRHFSTFRDGSGVGGEEGSDYKQRTAGLLRGFFPANFILGFISDELCIAYTRDGEILVRTGVEPNDSSVLDKDGWIRDNQLRLAWIPSEIRGWLSNPNELRFMKEGSIGVFCDRTIKGEEWSKCYIGDQSLKYDLLFSCD